MNMMMRYWNASWTECMAVVVDSVDDVIEYFDEAGMDVDGAVDDEILEADEVFDIGDGRYLIVEA